MRNRKIIYTILICLLALGVVLFAIIKHSQTQELKIIFLDVGQGDAVLISRGSNQILIDGGPSGQALLQKLGRYMPFWDRKIEMVVATHPDADHIGGLIDLMRTYRIGAVLDTKTKSESQVFQKYRETITDEKISEAEGEAGINIRIGENADVEILSPPAGYNPDEKDTNLNSIVARLTFGENRFLFTGDLPEEGEANLLKSKKDISAQVLKVAHHGSKYSGSEEFLKAVSPRDAVISVGKNNRYGHPAPEIIERLKNLGINIFRTDERGDIIYQCSSPDLKCQLVN